MIKYEVRNGHVAKVYEDGKYEFLTFDSFDEQQAEYIANLLNSETGASCEPDEIIGYSQLVVDFDQTTNGSQG